MDVSTTTKMLKIIEDHEQFQKSEIKPTLLNGVITYDYSSKCTYKRLDPQKTYYAEDITLSKEYEQVLLKYLSKLKKILPKD